MSNSVFVFDLHRKLRHDPQFRRRVGLACENLARIEREVADGTAEREDAGLAYTEVLRASGYNMAMLFPYYFPQYPEDKPLSLMRRPYMPVMSCLAPNSRIAVLAGRQVGKCAVGETWVRLRGGRRTTLREIFDAGDVIAPTQSAPAC